MRQVACIAAGLLLAGAALAQDGASSTEPRTWFQAVAFAPRINTDFRFDEDLFGSGTGSVVNGENDLGLPSRRTVAGLVFGRRLGQRWRFELDALRSQRDADTVMPRDVLIGGATYHAGDNVRSRTQLQFVRLNAGVSFVQSEQAEVGFLFGGLLSHFRIELRDAATSSTPLEWNVDDATPVIGLYFSAALAPAWRLDGRVEGGQRDGSSTRRASLDLRWQATPQIGLAAGVRWMAGTMTDSGSLLFFDDQRLDYRLLGPQLSASLSF